MPGMHIRYNTTGKYYEYSLSGTDTGPWTKLDLTGHTGTLPTNIAYVDVSNPWSVAQILPSFTRIKGNNNVLWFEATQATPEPKQWRVLSYDQGYLTWERFNAAGAYIGGGPTFMADGGLSVPAPLTATTVTVSGGIVSFPAAQVASVSANHLDDYEEGAFTPTLTTGAGAAIFSQQSGIYIKIGRKVTFTIRCIITSKNTMAGGNLTVVGLPFACETTQYHPVSVQYWLGLASNLAWLGGLVIAGSGTMDLRQTAGGQLSVSNLTTAQIANNFDFICGGTYIAQA